jgi:phosphoribosylaminoimidazole carboxylase (NCAIR synthetase)
MINLLGKTSGPGNIKNYTAALSDPSQHLHMYGKKNSRKGRKMGHITLIGDNPVKLLQAAKKAEKKIII